MSGESGYCSEPGEYGHYQDEEISDDSDYIEPKVSKRDLGAVGDQPPRAANVKPEELHQTPGMNCPKAEAGSKGVKKTTKKVFRTGASSTRLVLLQINGKPWYHGKMEREKAEEILAGKPALTFLVRHSYKPPVPAKDGYLRNRDRVVLSLILADGKTFKHAEINSQCVSQTDGEQIFKIYLTDKPIKMFDSVVELIYHYVGNSLQGVNSAVFKEEDRLKSYVTAVDPKQIEEITTMGRDVRRRPKLSTTKLERIFALDSSGGTLQLDSSDVKLIVPPGAIPEGLTYTIEKKIHVTDLDEFQSHVKFWDKNEHFISPIPEYNILQTTHEGRPIAQHNKAIFKNYVKICIPHCVNQEDCLQDIKVYCSDPANEQFGRPIPQANTYSNDGVLPQGSIRSDLDCFFTVDTEYVWVHTLHFTQYICTCRRECSLNLETLLFACMKQYTGKQEVYLSVYLCEALFRLREYMQTIIEDEAQLADPRILISRTALALPERLTHKDEFHIEIELDPDNEGGPWKHIVAMGFCATKILNAGDVLGCYHICQEGFIPPKPKDVKFMLRTKGPHAEMFSGHLHVNAAKKNGNPSYDIRNLNQVPFTVDLRDTPTRTGVVAQRSQREDAVSSILDNSLEGAAAFSSHSSDGATTMNRFAPQERSPASGSSQEAAAQRHQTAASSMLEEISASALK